MSQLPSIGCNGQLWVHSETRNQLEAWRGQDSDCKEPPMLNAYRFKRENFPMGKPGRQEANRVVRRNAIHYLVRHWKECKSLLDGFSQEGSAQIQSQTHNTRTQQAPSKVPNQKEFKGCIPHQKWKICTKEMSTRVLLLIDTSPCQEAKLELGPETRW